MLVCHQYEVCKIYVVSVYVGGYGGLNESEPCVFRDCVVSFLVVGESPLGLLYSVVMSYVNCGDDG